MKVRTAPKNHLPTLLGAAIALTTASFNTHAEESGIKLPNMVVIGKGESDLVYQPGSVAVVDSEQLELIQPRSTGDALRRIPGIAIKGEEESAVVVNIGMRGLPADSSKTLILEDGVPVAPGLFVGNGRYYNPRIQRMEAIEVLKGAASLRYGPSTIGGVINYTTKTPEPGAALSLRTGSWNTHEATVEVGGMSPSKDAIFGAVITKAQSDGFMDKGYDMTDIMLKAGMAVGTNQWLGIKYTDYDNEANISYRGLFVEDYENGADYNPAPDDYFITGRRGLDLNHEWDISTNLRLNTLVYWSETFRDYWRYGITNNNTDSPVTGRWAYSDNLNGNNRNFERVGIETRLHVTHRMFGIHNEAEIGLRYLTEEMKDQTIGATRLQDRTGTINRDRIDSADSLALFAQNRLSLTDTLAVTPGVRVEQYTQTRKDLTQDRGVNTAETDNTEVLPGVGLTWQLAPAAQVYGGVYKAFSPAENGVALDGLTDQELEAERSTNIELGVRGGQGGFRYEATTFQMDFTNQIIAGNSNPALSQTNAGKTLHQGMEMAAAFQFESGFFVDSNVTYIPISEYRSGDNKGNRIVYSPELLANLAVGYMTENLKTELSANHTGSQYASADNREEISGNNGGIGGIWGGELDAYTTLNLTAQYDLVPQLTLSGSIKNLTDERYVSGLRQGIYVGPERNFDIGVRYTF
ncbi:MAG: Fe(3+) dicitrate transport protein [Thalassolituus sp.]|jgi:Fe(3+) dicitrate transport protein